MIGQAYLDAKRALDALIQGKYKGYFKFRDEMNLACEYIVFDDKLLDEFRNYLYEGDMYEAKESFDKLMRVSEVECSAENKLYLRYEILQCLICYLKNSELPQKNIYIRECLNMDVRRDKKFVNTIYSILKMCMQKEKDDSFLKMLDYIKYNYHKSDLSGSDVAAVGNISKNYISKVFRQRLNMSYIEYLTSVRLDKACELLRTTDLQISEIAEQVGYANSVSFRRVFKERYGINASEYRKKEGIYKSEDES